MAIPLIDSPYDRRAYYALERRTRCHPHAPRHELQTADSTANPGAAAVVAATAPAAPAEATAAPTVEAEKASPSSA